MIRLSVEDVAEFVVERAKGDPRVKKIVEDVRLFDGLREHAGWRRLRDSIRADRDRFLLGIARQLMSGQEVDQRKIDFYRGYFQGALDTVERPEKAEENLERAARHAWALTQLEIQAESEEESPYA